MQSFLEMPKNEIPDESIWHHPQRLEEWLEAVEQRRKDDLQPTSDGGDDGLAQNELTRNLRD